MMRYQMKIFRHSVASVGAASLVAWTSVATATDVAFEKRTLTERFVAEGCAIADFDRDGHGDLTGHSMRSSPWLMASRPASSTSRATAGPNCS
jgi:hypothetical protein